MTRDPAPPEKVPGTADSAPSNDDDARTKEARRVTEEYASALREILQRNVSFQAMS
jgi:hypothetical protein